MCKKRLHVLRSALNFLIPTPPKSRDMLGQTVSCKFVYLKPRGMNQITVQILGLVMGRRLACV